MKNFIQALLNGYSNPAFLSDAHHGTILFTNKAFHKKLGFSKKRLAGMSLQDLLKDNHTIQNQPVFEHNNDYYLVQSEEVTFSGTEYTKSVLQTYKKNSELSQWDFQQEMSRRLIHRLRSPLNSGTGFSELLRATPLTEKQLQYLDAIEDGLNDLKSVLTQMEGLCNPVTVYKTKVDMRLLAEQVLAIFPEDQRKRIYLIIDENVKQKYTDFVLLKAIIEELLLNALQHGPKKPIITLHFTADHIRVNNESPPIPESIAGKIFHPFFSSKSRNIGIGLTKCANFAHQLKMNLTLAQNSDENGVSFDIIF